MYFKHDATHHASQCFVTPNQLYTLSGFLSSWLRVQAIRKLSSIPLTCFLAFRLVALITAGNWCEAECRFTEVGLGGLVLWLRYISGLSGPRTLLRVCIWHRGRNGWNNLWIHTRTVPSSWRHGPNYVDSCTESKPGPCFPALSPLPRTTIHRFPSLKFKQGREWTYVVRASFKWPAILIVCCFLGVTTHCGCIFTAS
jgi:hypothetical protein